MSDLDLMQSAGLDAMVRARGLYWSGGAGYALNYLGIVFFVVPGR